MKLGMPQLYEFDTIEENLALAKKLGLDFVELNLNFGYLYFDYFDFKGNEFYKITRDKFYWSYYYDIEGNPIQELEYFNKAYILVSDYLRSWQ